MKKFCAVIIVLSTSLFFGIGASSQMAGAYSGNSNIIVGLSPSECTAMQNPQTQLYFSQVMVTKNGVGGNQWSAQNNYYVKPNSWIYGWGENFAQFDMAISGSGQVYGSIELWAGPYGSFYNVLSNTIKTVSHIQAGDSWSIDTSTNANYQVTSVTYYYYDSAAGKMYDQSVSTGGYAVANVPLAWTVDIVGENGGLNVQFTSGGGQMYDIPGYTATYLSFPPSCVQGPIVGTQENSNMAYGSPVVNPSNQVDQSFSY